MEDTPSSFLDKKLDLSECEATENEEMTKIKDTVTLASDLIEAICDLDDPAFNNINLKSCTENMPIAYDLNVHSDGVGRAVKLALKAGALK